MSFNEILAFLLSPDLRPLLFIQPDLISDS